MVEQLQKMDNGTVIMSANERIDRYEAELLAKYPEIKCPLKHQFTPGLYCRMIFMPVGSEITSLVHRTCHQYAVLAGKVEVFTENEGVVMIEAPFTGVTMPGTRRALKIHEDTIWCTYHATDIYPESESEQDIETAVKKITEIIIEPYVNYHINRHLEKEV